jgi:hypothetical protein
MGDGYMKEIVSEWPLWAGIENLTWTRVNGPLLPDEEATASYAGDYKTNDRDTDSSWWVL